MEPYGDAVPSLTQTMVVAAIPDGDAPAAKPLGKPRLSTKQQKIRPGRDD